MKLLLASGRLAPKMLAIQPGLRADLILIEEDPLKDSRATRSIRIEREPIETGK
jgi:hypothetical protein